jgi:ribose transport system permease protein
MTGAADNNAVQPSRPSLTIRLAQPVVLWAAGRQSAMALVAVVIFAGFSLAAPTFFTTQNLVLVTQQTAFIGIVAVAETFLFVAGELDLSVGSAYGLASILMAWLIAQQGIDPWIAAFLVLGYGVVLGLFNGIVTVRIGVPSFIVTLGMLSLLRGLALFVSNNYPIQLPPELESSFFTVTGGTVFGTSVQVLWFVGIAIVGATILRSTTYGYHVSATGGNPVAAQEMGIDTRWIKVSAFVLTSTLAAFVGIVQVGWLRNAAPTTGSGFELQAIGAVLIGGTALSGGEGGVFGTVIGAMILGMMSIGLVLMGLPPESTAIASGAIIVAAGSSDALIRKRSRTLRTRRDREATTEAALDGAVQAVGQDE